MAFGDTNVIIQSHRGVAAQAEGPVAHFARLGG
jgi:hypothetical protein